MLLITGDSYSEPLSPWTAQFNAKVRGHLGWSNREIYSSLDGEEGVALISLTTLHRLPFKLQTRHYDDLNQSRNVTLSSSKRVYDLNCYWAQRIIDEWGDRSIIWSTFPDYESWKGVLWINLKQEDQMWETLYNQTNQFFSHLTVLGHKQLCQRLVDELKTRNLWDQTYLRNKKDA